MTMNLPTEIAPLEAELNRVIGLYDEDEKRLAQSKTPEIDRIFFASTKKLRRELEERLHRAKAEQQSEQSAKALSSTRERPDAADG